jgi:DNA polymerase-3 subunit alpha
MTERVAKGDLDKATMRRAGEYSEIFGKGNYYIELQNHGIAEQQRLNRGLIEVLAALGMP